MLTVHSVQNTLGWVWNKLRVEHRTTYHYEKGNDVTVVAYYDIAVESYSSNGELSVQNIGSKVDVIV